MADSQTRSLARRIAALEKQRIRSKQPTLGFSSIEDGSIMAVDEDGNLKMVIGKQFDGTQTATEVNGGVPPTPSQPTVAASVAGLTVSWNGGWATELVAPSDFTRVTVHVVANLINYNPLDPTQIKGEFNTALGGSVSFAMPISTWFVILTAWNGSGRFSAGSLPGTGTPDPVVPTAPTTAPSASPAVTLNGIPGGIVAVADAVASSTSIEYHISTSAFTAVAGDPTTLVAPASTTRVMLINHLPGSTTGLVEGTDYYVQTIALNVVGPAAPSASVVGRVNMSAVRSLVLAELIAYDIVAHEVSIGNARWNEVEGLVLPQPDGTATQFPVDGVTAATISGYIIANGMTVKDNANFYGLTQLFEIMRLGNGISDPAVAGTVSKAWGNVQTALNPDDFGIIWNGLCQSITDANELVVTESFFGGSVRQVDKTTGATNPFVFPNLGTFNPAGGIVVIAGAYYMLGYDTNRSSNWYIRKYTSSYAYAGVEISVFTATTTPKRPALGTDGTDLIVAYFTTGTSPVLRTRTFTTAGGGPTILDLDWTGPGYDIAGVYKGIADFAGGVTRYIVSVENSGSGAYNYSWATTGNRAPVHDFATPSGTRGRGLHWDGTRFFGMDIQGRLWKYATGHDQATSVDFKYSWYDGDSGGTGVHETKGSPAFTFSWPARSKIVYSARPAPEAGVTDPTKLDKANLIKIFAGPVGGSLVLQGSALAVGVTTLSREGIDTGTAAVLAASTFGTAGTLPGQIESTAQDVSSVPVTLIKGDGYFRAMKAMQSGTVTTGTLVANTPVTINVTFAVPFASAPTITCQAHLSTGFPETYLSVPGSVTTTGFVINAKRVTGTAGFNIHWQAMARTQ